MYIPTKCVLLSPPMPKKRGYLIQHPYCAGYQRAIPLDICPGQVALQYRNLGLMVPNKDERKKVTASHSHLYYDQKVNGGTAEEYKEDGPIIFGSKFDANAVKNKYLGEVPIDSLTTLSPTYYKGPNKPFQWVLEQRPIQPWLKKDQYEGMVRTV